MMKNIPNLDPLYNEVVAYVQEHQGENGYIDCQPSLGWDIIYAMMYDDNFGAGTEQYVYAVRYKDNDLQALLLPISRGWRCVYKPEDFTSEEAEENWFSVRWSDVYYVPTIFNIAEFIEEYA